MMLVSANAKAKYDILHSKEKHDELVDNSFITLVTAQAELFGRAHEEMQSILQLLPPDQVIIKSHSPPRICCGHANHSRLHYPIVFRL